MRLGLSQLAVSSVLLWYLRFAAASSSSEEDSDTSSKLENSVEKLKLKLRNEKKEIRTLVGDQRFKLCETRRHIKTLHKDFFDVLVESRLYPSLDKKTKTTILAMSPRSFGKRCDEWYNECTRVYEAKTERYGAEKEDLVPRIEREKKRHERHRLDRERAPESRKKLKALRSSLEKCDEKYRKYSDKLQTCEDYRSKIEALSRKVLGEKSVSALYEAYLADKKSLKTKSNDEHLQSPCLEKDDSQDYDDCVICLDPLEPGTDTIDCENRHSFHAGCLYEWEKQGKAECPTCRKPFTVVLKEKLIRYGEGDVESMSRLSDDPAFEDKCTENGTPIERSEDEARTLEAVCEKIRRCISRLKGHRHYAGVFNDREDNPSFYTPQNVVSYFETARPGHHDPRSRGFSKHKRALVRRIRKYLDSEVVDEDIMPVLKSLLGMLCIQDSVVEYLYTELCRINSPDRKRQKISENPMIFPALYASMMELPSDICITHIYDGFMNEIRKAGEGDAMHFCALRWLESF